MRRAELLEQSEKGEEEEDEEEPPQAPPGFKITPWAPRQKVVYFLLWCHVPGEEEAVWHRGQVRKVLSQKSKVYTHDATLDGTSQKRGVTLSPELHARGYWYKLSPVSD